jgi:hypothetical protein
MQKKASANTMMSVLHQVKSNLPRSAWRMCAVDLIDKKYQPTLLQTADAKWSEHQLIQFLWNDKVYYAIFYIEKDGYYESDIESFHYDCADGARTFVSDDKQATDDAFAKIKARDAW